MTSTIRQLRPLFVLFLWLAASSCSSALRTVALSGQQAQGTAPGVNYESFLSGAVLNGAGQIAFFASLTGPGVNATNRSGIWVEDAGSFDLVVRNGDPAPGTPFDVKFFVAGVNLVHFFS